jgi:hypothetical protein
VAGSRRKLIDLINPKDIDEPTSEPKSLFSALPSAEEAETDNPVTRWQASLSQLGESEHPKRGAGGEETMGRSMSGGSNESCEEVQEKLHACICGEWCTLDGTNFSGRLARR